MIASTLPSSHIGLYPVNKLRFNVFLLSLKIYVNGLALKFQNEHIQRHDFSHARELISLRMREIHKVRAPHLTHKAGRECV